MAAPRKDNKKRIKRNEIILLSIFGAIWLLGFILAILGVVAFNLPSLTRNNPLYSAQRGFAQFLGMGGIVDFRVFGTILFLVATIFILIVLRYYANKHDAIKSKQERRKQLVQEFLNTNQQTEPQDKTSEENKTKSE